ncbi:MAG: hypothetical protein HeimAB125_09130 [Candidatus Heimdallarchaeota archaeon AB_125]|nr:MAG: hypothetical protein HeimAB125_09130 [Candidatus Heimdallarchaeota archaeon AB_125]
MVETWKIMWDRYSFEKGLNEGFKKKYLWYMNFLKKGFFSNPELMYIGMSKNSVSERLLSRHAALMSAIRDFKERDIVLGLGFLASKKTITPTKIGYIESAMIAKFKPRLNAVGVKKFVSRGTVKIFSSGTDDIDWDILNWEI